MKKIKTVLLIDDMEIEHVNVRYVLEDFDEAIELISAYDGKEGLDILLKLDTLPDVILLDINMPCMNGLEFLAELEKTSFETPLVVVMLTSSNQEQDKKKASQYDAVKAYIGKPLEKEALKHIEDLL